MPQTITPAVKERIQDMLREKIREISGQLTDRIGKLTQTGRVTQRCLLRPSLTTGKDSVEPECEG